MDERKLTELVKEALAESKRNDCELINVKPDAGEAWRVELMDVMLKREPFAVRVSAGESASEQEIKESLRRAIAEHFSIESY
jgi:vacuolar-type H+-ATPase subunit F/Vma7